MVPVPTPAPPAKPNIIFNGHHDRHSAALMMTRQGRVLLLIDIVSRLHGRLFA